MMNSCNFTGRLVEDPKLMMDEGGVQRVTFTLAVDRDSAWKYDKSSDYLDFIAWREVAKYIVRKFKKGDLMTVINARAKVRNIVDSNGIKKRKTEFIVDKAYCSHRHKERGFDDGDVTENFVEIDI